MNFCVCSVVTRNDMKEYPASNVCLLLVSMRADNRTVKNIHSLIFKNQIYYSLILIKSH